MNTDKKQLLTKHAVIKKPRTDIFSLGYIFDSFHSFKRLLYILIVTMFLFIFVGLF